MRILQMAIMNVAAFRRRYVGLAVLTLLGVGLSLPLLSISAKADEAAQTRVREGAALRSIELLPQRQLPGGASLTPDGLARIRAVQGVQTVEPTLQATFGIKTRTIEGALLHATKLRPTTSPPVTRSVRPNVFPLSGDETVLPSTVQGMDLSSLLGTTVGVDYQQTIGAGVGRGARDTVRVVALYDPSWQLEGPDAAFVADPLLLKWAAAIAGVPTDAFLSTVGYDKATVVAATSAQVRTVLTRLQKAGYAATSLEQQLTALPPVLKLVHGLSRVFLVVIFVFLVLASGTLSSSLVRQRTREIGLLKAIGYRSSAVLRMLLLELTVTGVAFALVGIAVGALASLAAGQFLGRYPDIVNYVDATPVPSAGIVALLLVLPVVAVLLGGMRAATRGARLEPSVALRDW